MMSSCFSPDMARFLHATCSCVPPLCFIVFVLLDLAAWGRERMGAQHNSESRELDSTDRTACGGTANYPPLTNSWGATGSISWPSAAIRNARCREAGSRIQHSRVSVSLAHRCFNCRISIRRRLTPAARREMGCRLDYAVRVPTPKRGDVRRIIGAAFSVAERPVAAPVKAQQPWPEPGSYTLPSSFDRAGLKTAEIRSRNTRSPPGKQRPGTSSPVNMVGSWAFANAGRSGRLSPEGV